MFKVRFFSVTQAETDKIFEKTVSKPIKFVRRVLRKYRGKDDVLITAELLEGGAVIARYSSKNA